ncbi:hypothetical protein DRO34_07160, partial [Candidatus Bathyarchaeota archaeon]
MKIKKELERLLAEKAPGPAPSFSLFHVIRALELIAERSYGRLKLSEELNIGEGATRTLLKRLKEAGLVSTSKTGCQLTQKGEKLWRRHSSIFKRKVSVEKNELTLAEYNVAILISNSGDKVKCGMKQRDAAVITGAKGAVTLVYANGKLTVPCVSDDVAETYPKAYRQLMKLLRPEENDVIIIASAEAKEKA